MEELMKAKEAILKDMKKKTKYIRKNDDDDINDLFDDGDEYYKSHPEKRNQISKPQYNVNNVPHSNNNTQLLFDFTSNFANNNSQNFPQSNNTQQKSGDLLGFDFDTPSTVNNTFNFDQHFNANNNNGFNFDQRFGMNQQTNTAYQPMSNNANNYQPLQPQGQSGNSQQNILNFFQ